jgi:Na+/H+ antiporter NhaC
MFKHVSYALIMLAIVSGTFFLQGDPAQQLDATMSQVNGDSQDATNFFISQSFYSMLPFYSLVAMTLTTLTFYGRTLKETIKSTFA